MGKLKRTTEEVKILFAEVGCTLIGEYQGAMIPMKYICHCGQESQISWNRFSTGSRCGYCTKWGQKKKRSLDEIKNIFKDRGCEFLDTEFKSTVYNHRYRCKCGKESKITFSAFYHQKQYCKSCGLSKIQKEKHHSWKPDREKHRLDQLFRKKCYKALSSTLKAIGKEKVGHTSDMIGYGPKELQQHIINHSNWKNCQDLNWHLDHIFPIEAFLEHNISDVALINCLENLQPLSSTENNKKWAHYDKVAFQEWLKTKNIIT